MKKFYTETLADTKIQNKLAHLAVMVEQLSAGNILVSELETTRTNYLREVGELQETTKTKDAAIQEISDWMQDVFIVARIALEDKPQLLEALYQ